MKNQKNRSMKVYSQNGRNYKATPTIILKGQWLEKMGFAIGNYISVNCENGKLVIMPDTERAELEQMKADFMEKELRSYTGCPALVTGRYCAEHPFCEKCYERGVLVPVEEIHHKLPLSEGGTHDQSNLIALCKSCHSQIHAKRGDCWGK